MDLDFSETESIEGDDVEIQYANPTLEDAVKIAEDTEVKQTPSKKPKKEIDVRASKGRKIRYLKIPKAVDFMFPVITEHFSDVQRSNIIAQMKESIN